MVNMTILYGSYFHSVVSVFIIFASISLYFVIFYLFSSLGIEYIDSIFFETMSIPVYWPLLLFFFLHSFPIDMFLNFVRLGSLERQAEREKEKKEEEKRDLMMAQSHSLLAPLKRVGGYAFSGEAGHVPQIT